VPTLASAHPDDSAETTRADALASSATRWACFICGVALLAGAMFVPAREDLARVEHQRDTALAIEAHHEARIDRYDRALASIDRGDPDTMARLTHASLGLIPEHTEALVPSGAQRDPMLFELLEPEPFERPVYERDRSRFERLVLSETTRLWVIAGAALLALIGLLPRAAG